jgi:hypothetical protein
MAKIDINSIISDIEQGVGSLAGNLVPGYISEAEKDSGNFLNQIKANLKKWATQLVNGQISKDDFSDLVGGYKELLKMAALTKAGVEQAKLDSFKAGLFGLIEKVVFALI